MFPGVKPEKIKKALDNRKNQKKDFKPIIPKVTSTMMNMDGDFSIDFDVPMMMPETMSTAQSDLLLEI